jgi:nucleoside phosphorylase
LNRDLTECLSTKHVSLLPHGPFRSAKQPRGVRNRHHLRLTNRADAVEALIDEEYEKNGFSYGKAVGDANTYTIGWLGHQHVVLAYMPGMGMISAAAVAAGLRSSFERIKVAIVVGICGGVPVSASEEEILLGDVIISTSVIQIDFGRLDPNGFVRKTAVDDTLGRANPEIRSFVEKVTGRLGLEKLQDKTSTYAAQIGVKKGFSKFAYPGPDNDKLYPPEHRHKHWKPSSCSICYACQSLDDHVCEEALKTSCEKLCCDKSEVVKRKRFQKAMGIGEHRAQLHITEIKEAQRAHIHVGRIACSSQVMRSGQHRDQIATREGVIGFEMESAGTWDYVPTVVIKSVCDYADSHKNKEWQEYSAATAAACTKAVLEEWRSVDRSIPSSVNQRNPGQKYFATLNCLLHG